MKYSKNFDSSNSNQIDLEILSKSLFRATDFSSVISLLKDYKGLSINYISEKSGISKTTLSKLYNNNMVVSKKYADNLSKAFDIDTEFLFMLSKNPEELSDELREHYFKFLKEVVKHFIFKKNTKIIGIRNSQRLVSSNNQ